MFVRIFTILYFILKFDLWKHVHAIGTLSLIDIFMIFDLFYISCTYVKPMNCMVLGNKQYNTVVSILKVWERGGVVLFNLITYGLGCLFTHVSMYYLILIRYCFFV